MTATRKEILQQMSKRILILDGATGTYLQQLNLPESMYRGCNDELCVTHPEIIEQMHRAYLDAGADIIETNSFNCNRFSLADYGLEDRVYELSKAAAECARRAIDSLASPLKGENNAEASPEGGGLEGAATILVAGSMGPSNQTLSISPEVENPAKRNVTFDEMAETFYEQAKGLIDGGADVLLVETIFDTLNAKAALFAIDRLGSERQMDIPVMVSGTLSDASGRTLSGQTVEAYYTSLRHYNLISIGLNCGFGAKQLLPWLKRLADVAECAVSVHPNAGLPNVMGGYDETPELFAEHAKAFLAPDLEPAIAARVRPDSGTAYVNIIGGCCGTTPEHIRLLAETAKNYKPRALRSHGNGTLKTMLSGLENFTIEGEFVKIGERCNVAGSAKFKRLIKEENYDEALSIARSQVESGAQVIDVCMDDGMIDGVGAMQTFLNLIASEPEIARVPVMIDSSKWDIICAGLKCVQGKSIVNSISLKEGEETFLKKARHIHAMGAATVVMLFDENGQADTYERKVTVARRAYKLLQSIGFPTEDVIFDPNVLAVATGMAEHNDYGRAFIAACETIKNEMPEVHLSGGISNLSFSFRGINTVRQAMHSVLLHHARKVGLDMSIVNPAMTVDYNAIQEPLKSIVEYVILNRRNDAGDDLLELAQQIKDAESSASAANPAPKTAANAPVEEKKDVRERINNAFLNGKTDTIEADTLEALGSVSGALAVIDQYLMPAMERVGELFGQGKMFLPQVVKSARVMKKAVGALEPYMRPPLSPCKGETNDIETLTSPEEEGQDGAVIMATVKGDVHDIGKNIVSVVVQCNGYTVKDLGVMVPPEVIVEEAKRTNASVIGLSGLITPSLDEMINVVRLLEKEGLQIPVIVGGATTSALHTAVKIAPEYPHGVVIRAHAAADNPSIIRRLIGEDSAEFIAEHKNAQRILRENYLSGKQSETLLTLEEARKRRHVKKLEEVAEYDASKSHHIVLHPTISELLPLINWNFFFQAWGLKGAVRTAKEGSDLKADALQMLSEMERNGSIGISIAAEVLPAYSTDEDEIVINGHTLPFPRSLKDEQETNCLADYILRKEDCKRLLGKGSYDAICPFCVTAGIGLKVLQEQYRKDGDEYRAIMAKLLCDRLAQAASEWLQDYLVNTLHWGSKNISMAFGYGACPDHRLKRDVFEMLDIEKRMGLHLTDSHMITPEESICGLIFANTPVKYFNV